METLSIAQKNNYTDLLYRLADKHGWCYDCTLGNGQCSGNPYPADGETHLCEYCEQARKERAEAERIESLEAELQKYGFHSEYEANEWKNNLYSRGYLDKASTRASRGLELIPGEYLKLVMKKHPVIAKKIIAKINDIYYLLHQHLDWWTGNKDFYLI